MNEPKRGRWIAKADGSNGQDYDSQWVPENEEFSGSGPPPRGKSGLDWKTVAALYAAFLSTGIAMVGIGRYVIHADTSQLVSDHASAAAANRTSNTNEILTLKQRCADFTQWRNDTNGILVSLLDNRTECAAAIAATEEYRRADDAQMKENSERMTRIENQLTYLLQHQRKP